MRNYFAIYLLLAAGACICGCKSTKNSSMNEDEASLAMQGGPGGMGTPPQGRGGTFQNDRGGGPGGGGMPPGGGGAMTRSGSPGMPPGGGGGAPGGGPGGGMPPGRHGMSQFSEELIAAVYMATEGELSKNGESIDARGENQSAVVARNDSKVVLSRNTINTSGNTTSQDHSSFEGLNAAVLGRGNSQISMSANMITTSGLGANGVFAHGGSVIVSEKDMINCTGDGGHGIMCSGGGTIHATDIYITTSGKNSAPVATDRGSGTITVNGGLIASHGQDSPGLYSTGKLIVSRADISSDGSEVAVIEGSNLISLESCRLTCSFPDKWGIMIYQSFSGDAEGVDGEFISSNSTISVTGENSPLFFVTNSTANITLKSNEINCASGILLDASASRWGRKGQNGGTAVIKTSNQVLEGDLLADAESSIRLALSDGSMLKGSVNPGSTAKSAEVEIDYSSVWELSDDAYVTRIDALFSGGEVSNIVGNGYDVYYDAANNPQLGGKSYALQGGGELKALQ